MLLQGRGLGRTRALMLQLYLQVKAALLQLVQSQLRLLAL
jgi:hypothetical protein